MPEIGEASSEEIRLHSRVASSATQKLTEKVLTPLWSPKIYQLTQKLMFHYVSTFLIDGATCFLRFSLQLPDVLLPQPALLPWLLKYAQTLIMASMRCSSCPKTPCCMESVVLVAGAAGKLCPPGLWDSWEHLITIPNLSLFYLVLICPFLSAPNQWVWNQNAAWPNFLASWRQTEVQRLLNIRLKQERHKRCKPWISGYLIILALNIWSATPFSSSIYVSWMLMSMLRWSISHLRNSSSINISFDAVSEMAWCSTERKPVISSARLPATTLSLPGRSPPESLKGVPPWMQSLGKDTGDLVPLVPLTLTYKFISLTSYQFWNLLQLCMLPEFPGKWISFVHVGEVHLLFSVWSASCFS